MPVGAPTYLDYSPDADDNQAAPPIGAPEGNYKGMVVNDTFRQFMAAFRRLADGVLHLDGSKSPSIDISWGGVKITNLGFGTARTHAAALGQVQDQRASWGGTSAGSGAAYTLALTPSYTPAAYTGGQQVRFLAHADNTVTTPTLKVDSGPVTLMTHRNAVALRVGDLQSGHRYTAEYDNVRWRVLDAHGFMDQVLYNQLYPIGATLLRRVNNPIVLPVGVAATWSRVTDDDYYLRVGTGDPQIVGGALETAPSPDHLHADGSLIISPVFSTFDAPSGARQFVAGLSAAVTGNTALDGSHQHTINPLYRTYVVWERIV